LKQS